MNVKIYVLDRLPTVPDCFLLQLLQGSQKDIDKRLFQSIDAHVFTSMVTFVTDPKEADVFFLPHSYFVVYRQREYIKKIVTCAKTFNKKIIVFSYSDISKKITLPNAIILRSSQYRNTQQPNEIIIPAFVEDLGAKYGIDYRVFDAKRQPVVGFAGWVFLGSLKKRLVAWLKKVGVYCAQRTLQTPQIQGIFFRRNIVRVLEDSVIGTQFFIRDSYSANRNTIQGDPEQVRKQFVQAITDSDFPLCVKGDGNYSLRFYEVLSLGRIPLFIDTECPLPLSDHIKYDDFIVRVDYKDIQNAPNILAAYWAQMTPEIFIQKQKMARQVFEQHLRADVFYGNFFRTLKELL
jgi:hypothetical protein